MPMTIFKRVLCLLFLLIATLLLVPRFGIHAEAMFDGPIPLGPASELVLEGEGDNKVTLKAIDSQLAWGDAPSHRNWSQGWVSVGPLLDQLMRAESFQEERNTLSEEMQADEQLIIDALESIRGQMEGLEPDDPDVAALAAEGRNLLEQRRAFMQAAQMAQSQLTGVQLERAYREVIDAVKIVAEMRGIDLVHRFIPTDDPFKGTTAADATLEIRLRSLLFYPEDLDITDDVAKELGVELNGP